jgi:cell division protein FtsB
MTEQQAQQNWFTLPRILFWILVILFFSLQLRLWIGDGSLAEVWQLNSAIERQETENRLLEERNKRLRAEVKNLKEGLDAVEERARTQLGMIKEDETFFLIKEDNTLKPEQP